MKQMEQAQALMAKGLSSEHDAEALVFLRKACQLIDEFDLLGRAQSTNPAKAEPSVQSTGDSMGVNIGMNLFGQWYSMTEVATKMVADYHKANTCETCDITISVGEDFWLFVVNGTPEIKCVTCNRTRRRKTDG